MLKSAKWAALVVNLRRRGLAKMGVRLLPCQRRARIAKGKPLVISLAGPKAVAGFPHGFPGGFRPGRAGPTPTQPRASNVQDVVAFFLLSFNTQLY
jgi:hypothetical protein